MKEHGILFRRSMVRAILEGQKDQTRRLLYVPTSRLESARVDQRYETPPGPGPFPPLAPGKDWTLSRWYGAQVGDRLWGRETFCAHWGPRIADWAVPYTGDAPIPQAGGLAAHASPAQPLWVYYRATDERKPDHIKWTPSIHMPRWTARITPLILEKRIERLQAITERQACNEGAPLVDVVSMQAVTATERTYGASWRLGFKLLWESINGAGSWDENPWVIVLRFERMK